MNWSAVGFTPSGGSLTAIVKVQEVQVDPGGSLIDYQGDGDRFPTTVVNAMNNPKATVRTGDIATILGFVPGTVGIFTGTHNDAKGASGGAIVYVMINSVVENSSNGGAHAQYGEGTLSMRAFSSDGVTNPLSFTRV
jgi:uncharacterized protein RhaS with RHS repeats